MTKDEALKNHAEKYELTLDQFRMMCKGASETYEGQGMISTDYALAREAYFAGFTKACKEALAQPAQEPVAWMSEGGVFTRTKEHAESWSIHGGKVTPVYTHPAPSWQGLSDDEIDEQIEKASIPQYQGMDVTATNLRQFAKNILNIVKVKNND